MRQYVAAAYKFLKSISKPNSYAFHAPNQKLETNIYYLYYYIYYYYILYKYPVVRSRFVVKPERGRNYIFIMVCWSYQYFVHLSHVGTATEIQLPLERSSRFQRLFPNPSWLPTFWDLPFSHSDASISRKSRLVTIRQLTIPGKVSFWCHLYTSFFVLPLPLLLPSGIKLHYYVQYYSSLSLSSPVSGHLLIQICLFCFGLN